MKHIKLFESLTGKIYRKNNIVLLSENSTNIEEFELPYARIIERYKSRPDKEPIDRYYVEIIFPNKNFWAYDPSDEKPKTVIYEYHILRKLTPEEVKDMNLKLSAKKYNI